jgi:hypothetical protein
MPDATKVAKAELREIEIKADITNEINEDKNVKVQFNPETLKVSFKNTVVAPAGGGDQNGTPSLQYVGSGSTSLTLQLWFDLTVPQSDTANQVSDVRKYTEKVAYFITPAQKQENNATIYIPPAVRFLWGSFQFDGIMTSLEESLEFFSSEGIPLRASITVTISQQKIQQVAFHDTNLAGGMPSVGSSPLTLVTAGATVQGIADKLGVNWRDLASANGISNPRKPTLGQLIHVAKGIRSLF